MARSHLIALSTVTIVMTLSGCSSEPPIYSRGNDWFYYENKELSYSINIPINALISWKGKVPTDGPETGFATYPVLSQPQKDDYSIFVRSSSAFCDQSLTGASQMDPLTIFGGEAKWGKSDLIELLKQEGYIPPYETENVKCGGAAPHVYAFCSEKDGNTVIICINQVTDNPALAEEILKTFKWTK